MQKSRALALGLTSSVVLACGIAMAVLLDLLVAHTEKLNSNDKDYATVNSYMSGSLWAFSMMYIIPGLISFIAALVQHKALYITSCILSMIIILGSGGMVPAGIFLIKWFVRVLVRKDQCVDLDEKCNCNFDDSRYGTTYHHSCDYLFEFTHLGISLSVVMVLGWIFLVVVFVLACYYACKTEQTPGQVLSTAPAQDMRVMGNNPYSGQPTTAIVNNAYSGPPSYSHFGQPMNPEMGSHLGQPMNPADGSSYSKQPM